MIDAAPGGRGRTARLRAAGVVLHSSIKRLRVPDRPTKSSPKFGFDGPGLDGDDKAGTRIRAATRGRPRTDRCGGCRRGTSTRCPAAVVTIHTSRRRGGTSSPPARSRATRTGSSTFASAVVWARRPIGPCVTAGIGWTRTSCRRPRTASINAGSRRPTSVRRLEHRDDRSVVSNRNASRMSRVSTSSSCRFGRGGAQRAELPVGIGEPRPGSQRRVPSSRQVWGTRCKWAIWTVPTNAGFRAAAGQSPAPVRHQAAQPGHEFCPRRDDAARPAGTPRGPAAGRRGRSRTR